MKRPRGSRALALSSVILFFNAADQLWHQSQPESRFHGIIEEGGQAPNAVPDRTAALMWGTRAFIPLRDIRYRTPTSR